MAAISSVGIGSGLDVKSIVSQLVALEKQPLAALQTKEAGIQTKITTFSQIKSLVSTFADAASKLTLDSGWGAMTVNSSDSTAVNAAVSGVATAGEYAFEVQQLAHDVVVAVGRRPVDRRRVPPLVAGALPPQREVAGRLLHRRISRDLALVCRCWRAASSG